MSYEHSTYRQNSRSNPHDTGSADYALIRGDYFEVVVLEERSHNAHVELISGGLGCLQTCVYDKDHDTNFHYIDHGYRIHFDEASDWQNDFGDDTC
jgi:hypothetical protein